MAEFRAPRSERERMLHRRARGFAPITVASANGLIKQQFPCFIAEADLILSPPFPTLGA